MLLFRSLTLGLMGAMLWMQLDTDRLPARPPHAAPVVAQASGPTIIDVAPGIPGASLTGLVRVKPGEHVVTVDDHPVINDLEAGAAITDHQQPYVDIELANASGDSRRVLLLCH